jgi:hypothetical protein
MTLTNTALAATSHLEPMSRMVAAGAGAGDLSAGRLGAMAAAAAAVVGIFLGGRALARSADRAGSGPRTGMALGAIAIVAGGLVAATSDGTVGTGNGLGGAVVAIVAGLIAVGLGALARARSHRQA